MARRFCTEKTDEVGGDELHPVHYVVRSPEIVWLPDDAPVMGESDIGADPR